MRLVVMHFRSNINEYKLGKKPFYSSCKPQYILFFAIFTRKQELFNEKTFVINVSFTLEIQKLV